MTHFVWSKEYELGIDVIDHQHMRIIDYINRVYEALNSGADESTQNEILTGLMDYTFSHLAFEEAMLEEVDYQDLSAHKLSHKAFTELVNHLQQSAKEGRAVGAELANLLQNWLIAHIMVEDAKYVPAVKTLLLKEDGVVHHGWLREAVTRYFQ
ncbi:bacteriohemerythrin [Halioxenophilus sp. WMMB6]|uniref:bacteriohemerythrin n=1 Tax=Halioxenophilus sp. WMMB6 TaxID=3073815 RepID=UPI00295F58CF|nr:bacteriohemerythrin [Halioxenophilus sp. WMMB6]